MFLKKEELKNPIGYPVGSEPQNLLRAIDVYAGVILEVVKPGEIVNLFCRGSSGAIIAGMLSIKLANVLTIYIKHVKKDGENSHSMGMFFKPNHINIIVDDFVSSGQTIDAIYEKIFSIQKNARIRLLLVSGVISCLTVNEAYINKTMFVAAEAIDEDYFNLQKELAP